MLKRQSSRVVIKDIHSRQIHPVRYLRTGRAVEPPHGAGLGAVLP